MTTLPPRSDGDILISVKISTPSEWIELNDGITYTLAKETFAGSQVNKRIVKATNPYLEGEIAVHSLREQVVETIAVRISAETDFALNASLEILTGAFDQIEYRIVKQIGNSWRVWFCNSANYRIETPQELIHATMAKVTFEVPRHPVAALLGEMPVL